MFPYIYFTLEQNFWISCKTQLDILWALCVFYVILWDWAFVLLFSDASAATKKINFHIELIPRINYSVFEKHMKKVFFFSEKYFQKFCIMVQFQRKEMMEKRWWWWHDGLGIYHTFDVLIWMGDNFNFWRQLHIILTLGIVWVLLSL